jgi:RNA polymerase sigma-70 factor (ECF subfamily)
VTVDQSAWLERFEESKPHLRAVAYRMLGSLTDADDAVQECWLQVSRSDAGRVRNLHGWLTTAIARVCLDILRSRKSRREDPFDAHVPEPVVTREHGSDPEQELLFANAIGLALLVVLDTLPPGERLAFVLHDMFGVPFEEIASILGKSPTATRQLASRARRRVQGAATPDPDLGRQQEVVKAFLEAGRNGNFEALLALLDPEVVLKGDRGSDTPGASKVLKGARVVAAQASLFSHLAQLARPALVNGAAGIVGFDATGRPVAVLGFTITRGKIMEIDILADPARIRKLDLPSFDD